MENLISALLIAIVQGLTEWLPISSSGHLVVVEKLLGYEGGLMFDVALHFGTLMAVFVYFGKDITDIIGDILKGDWKSDNAKLGFLILIATIPAGIMGLLFRDIFEFAFSSLVVTGFGFAVTGLLLFVVSIDFDFSNKSFGWRESLGVGMFQVLSLFPGISRSGSSLSGALLFGLKEKAALKFSFLMSIPVIFGANILIIGNQSLPSELIWATFVSFFVGLMAIHILYNYLLNSRKNLRWFGFYALILAVVILSWSVLI